MPQARRMIGGLSDAEREELKQELRREVLGEIQDSLHSGDSLTEVRDAVDIRLERDEPRELDIDTIRQMSAEEINAHWTEVQRVMSAQRQTRPVEEPAQQTGPLNWEKIRAMTPEEHTARRGEVEAFLQREGQKS